MNAVWSAASSAAPIVCAAVTFAWYRVAKEGSNSSTVGAGAPKTYNRSEKSFILKIQNEKKNEKVDLHFRYTATKCKRTVLSTSFLRVEIVL